MKPTIRSLICAAAVLSSLCVRLPEIRADDTTDYIDQIYQDQRQLDDYQERMQETERYVDQIYKDQQERDDYLNAIWRNALPEAPVAVPRAIPLMIPARAAPQRFPMPPDPRQVFAIQQMQLRQIMLMQQLQWMRFQR